jgi:hypothetical protein
MKYVFKNGCVDFSKSARNPVKDKLEDANNERMNNL